MDVFDAPIPGQSLTAQPGGMALERPPQFVDPNQALEFLFKRLTQPKFVARLVVLLKSDTPIEYIVRTVLFEGVTKGNWTPDVAMLMAQTVTWMVESIAIIKGIKVKLKNPDMDQMEFMSGFTDLLEKDKPKAAPTKAPLFTGL